MGMVPYDDDGFHAGSEDDLLAGSAAASMDGTAAGESAEGGGGDQGNVALAMMTGGGKAAAVVQQAAARTRSGITTRLGGARLQAAQAAALAAASKPQAKQPYARPSPSSAGRGLSKRQAAAAAAEEEEDDEDDEDLDSEDEEGGMEDGSGAGGLRRRKKAKLTLKPLTEQQRVERRERNREHAKRSRMRKKFMLESLQAQMQALRKENLRLRQLVTTKIPEKAEGILRGCASIKAQNALSTVELGHHRALADSDGKLISALQFAQQNFTVSDPSLPDNPIVYASQGFLDLTGYTSDQIVGRNCRFLQGPGTDPAAVDIIRRGVALGEDTSVCLLNYRADGTPFWNQFFVAALRDSDGNIVNYVGVQCKVEEAPIEEELKERVKTINFEEA
jgi:PAS domain S-box-containing protein